MKIKNSINLLLLSGLIASCVSRVGTADKTFDAPGSFSSIVSKEQDNPKSENQAEQKQENQEPKAPTSELGKPVTEKERIQKLKEDYFKKFADTESFDMQCNSTGCTSITEETFPKGPSIIRTDYIVDKDSIKPFKPNTEGFTTTYKADTLVKIRRYDQIKNHKGTMELNIDNATGIGNAKTSIDNVNHSHQYGIRDIDIRYNNIDYTKEKFYSNNVDLNIRDEGQPTKCADDDCVLHLNGEIEGSLSGESNSSGRFSLNTHGIDNFEVQGVFSGKDKQVCKNYCDCNTCK